jgi:lysozyme
MLKGIDVSSYQGDFDWKAVAAEDIAFAFIKCSDGNIGDPTFAKNASAARAAGVLIGGYHFARPLPPQDGQPWHVAAEQAKRHFALSKGLGAVAGDLPPALDFEWPEPDKWAGYGCSKEQLRDWALAYLNEATSLWGCPPVIYSYPDFILNLEIATVTDFASYPLWLAQYSHPTSWPTDAESPNALAPWKQWTFWQSSGGQFFKLSNGASSDVDNFLGTHEELVALSSKTLV